MDPQTDLPSLLEDLEVNIDELSATLTPLLPPHTLSKAATTLPLLSRAKLYTLTAYAIESTLFSTLLASGADAKAHPLFAELARLKTYFAKIKHAEEHFERLAEKENRARVDVGAAQRFIKHGLSGNERYDEMRRERVVKEKERALEKARKLTNKKFEDEEGTPKEGKRAGEEDTEEETPKKRARADAEEEDDEEEEEEQEEVLDTPQPPAKKRGRPSKKDKETSNTPQKDTPTRATRSKAPKTRSEAFQTLAAGATPPAAASKGKGRKGKGRGK